MNAISVNHYNDLRRPQSILYEDFFIVILWMKWRLTFGCSRRSAVAICLQDGIHSWWRNSSECFCCSRSLNYMQHASGALIFHGIEFQFQPPRQYKFIDFRYSTAVNSFIAAFVLIACNSRACEITVRDHIMITNSANQLTKVWKQIGKAVLKAAELWSGSNITINISMDRSAQQLAGSCETVNWHYKLRFSICHFAFTTEHWYGNFQQ